VFAVESDCGEEMVAVQEVERSSQASDWQTALREIHAAVSDEHNVSLHATFLVRSGSIPRTTSGKVQRRECQALFLRGELAIVARCVAEEQRISNAVDWPSRGALAAMSFDDGCTAVQSCLQQEIAALVGIPAVTCDWQQPVRRLGLDSLAATELAANLESRLGVHLSAT
jgi:hypothetical protein